MILVTAALVAALASPSAPPALCSTDADCAAHGYQDAYGVTPDKIRLYSDRYYPAEDAADPIAECLLRAGYRGLSGDHEEVIYAPRTEIEACASEERA